MPLLDGSGGVVSTKKRKPLTDVSKSEFSPQSPAPNKRTRSSTLELDGIDGWSLDDVVVTRSGRDQLVQYLEIIADMNPSRPRYRKYMNGIAFLSMAEDDVLECYTRTYEALLGKIRGDGLDQDDTAFRAFQDVLGNALAWRYIQVAFERSKTTGQMEHTVKFLDTLAADGRAFIARGHRDESASAVFVDSGDEEPGAVVNGHETDLDQAIFTSLEVEAPVEDAATLQNHAKAQLASVSNHTPHLNGMMEFQPGASEHSTLASPIDTSFVPPQPSTETHARPTQNSIETSQKRLEELRLRLVKSRPATPANSASALPMSEPVTQRATGEPADSQQTIAELAIAQSAALPSSFVDLATQDAARSQNANTHSSNVTPSKPHSKLAAPVPAATRLNSPQSMPTQAVAARTVAAESTTEPTFAPPAFPQSMPRQRASATLAFEEGVPRPHLPPQVTSMQNSPQQTRSGTSVRSRPSENRAAPAQRPAQASHVAPMPSRASDSSSVHGGRQSRVKKHPQPAKGATQRSQKVAPARPQPIISPGVDSRGLDRWPPRDLAPDRPQPSSQTNRTTSAPPVDGHPPTGPGHVRMGQGSVPDGPKRHTQVDSYRLGRASGQHAPSQQAPSQHASSQQAPRQQAPRQQAPRQQAPIQHGSTQDSRQARPRGASVGLSNYPQQVETARSQRQSNQVVPLDHRNRAFPREVPAKHQIISTHPHPNPGPTGKSPPRGPQRGASNETTQAKYASQPYPCFAFFAGTFNLEPMFSQPKTISGTIMNRYKAELRRLRPDDTNDRVLMRLASSIGECCGTKELPDQRKKEIVERLLSPICVANARNFPELWKCGFMAMTAKGKT